MSRKIIKHYQVIKIEPENDFDMNPIHRVKLIAEFESPELAEAEAQRLNKANQEQGVWYRTQIGLSGGKPSRGVRRLVKPST